jgi:thioredoxin 1
MEDLDVAKKRLQENSLTLTIVNSGEIIFETASRGISGFLEAIEKFGDNLQEASVADRVIGKAIALLCVYAKVKAVYAIVLSEKAKVVFEQNMIYHEWNELVESILDGDNRELCPFEKLAAKISNPSDAYKMLKALQASLRHEDEGEMSSKREQFISEEDAELKHIREKKLMKLLESKAKGREISVEPIHVTDSNFNEIVKKHPLILVDFWASWCGPCRALAPTIEELAKEYAGKVAVGKLNVDENPKTAESFQVFSIPTMVIMKDGCEVDRIVGLVPKQHVEAVLKKYLG